MKKLAFVLSAAALGMGITGCKSFAPPMDLEQTARDAETYKTDAKVPVMPRQKIVIVSKSLTPKGNMIPQVDKYIMDKVEGTLAVYFTNLGNTFDTIDRKNGLTIDSEAILNGDKNGIDPTKVAGADYILIAETSYSWKGILGRGTFDPQKGSEASVKTNFRLISTATKETILTKEASSRCEYEKGTGGWQKGVNDCTDLNAREFARLVSARILPPAKVRQTRGSGWAAQVSMGKNYLVTPGATVEFLTVEEDGPSPFARGVVYSADDKNAWVEVANYEKAGVKKGHFVKLVAEETLKK